MSAGKVRPLSVRVAYLRLASEGRLALNVKWTRKLTPFVARMIQDGELVTRRNSDGRGGKAVTNALITPVGQARLDQALAQFGPDFGPIGEESRDQPSRAPKDVRRKRVAEPEPRHVASERRRARNAKRFPGGVPLHAPRSERKTRREAARTQAI